MNNRWQELSKVLQPAMLSTWEWLAVGVGLVVLIWLTFRVKAWFHDDDASTDPAVNLLVDLHELRREGGLSEEEFRLINTQLMGGKTWGKSPSRTSAKPAGSNELAATDHADESPQEPS
ncbi:hypothetical protein GC163_15595 [bacterium]|nr:hypothetical protein [bacterium]